MTMFGSTFSGPTVDGRMEGDSCTYSFADGTKYIGSMLDGEFHGKGVLHFPWGGTFAADWDHGKAVGEQPSAGSYTYGDGLEHKDSRWDYCSGADRRFYSERCNGIKPAGQSFQVNKGDAPRIPLGHYDCGDGSYDPETNTVLSYAGERLRVPDAAEVEWIMRTCRKGV